MDPWFTDNLVCPIDHLPLEYRDGYLVSTDGRRYPVVAGIPVMLVPEEKQTIRIANASLRAAKDHAGAEWSDDLLFLETLGISDQERAGVQKLADEGRMTVDPIVSFLVGATSGYSYAHLIGRLESYPIPDIRLPVGHGQLLLDIGCNWGRWSAAAARKGYTVVGIDPSLGAVLAAARVAKQLGLTNRYLVADGRFLPFKPSSFSVAFSYSVIQHLSKQDARYVLEEVGRVLEPGGISMIQMANAFGGRSLYHQARRRFKEATNFDVRYWSERELIEVFTEAIGPSTASVDCYFGLGLQISDVGLMPRSKALLVKSSEMLRKVSEIVRPLRFVADSLYIHATKT